MMHQEDWMKLRTFKPLADAGMPWAEIARAAGVDWRTAKRYLTADPATPPRYGPRPPVPRLIDPFVHVIDAALRGEPRIRASVIHERLVAERGFTGHYAAVKRYVRVRRPQILAELGLDGQASMHRRVEVLPGAQAQVDWGDEGTIITRGGAVNVYSFHMVLSHSRDPYCLLTTSMDLSTFWAAHTAAFEHFGGVPAQIVYDRTKTVVRRHVGVGQDVPLHPEALAFAEHNGFVIDLCAAGRPESKGKVERQVAIVRQHAFDGRTFTDLAQMQAAVDGWLPIRRAQVHRTHGEVIAVRAERDRAALLPLPAVPYVVCDREIRTVGKDALISFGASLYSVPWRLVRPRQRVELRITREHVAIHTIGAEPVHLATHRRASLRGSWVVDPLHWDGLPDRTRPAAGPTDAPTGAADATDPVAAGIVAVARRELATYDALIGGVR